MTYLLAALLIPVTVLLPGCFGLDVPGDSSILAPFAPIGRWAGHWGVDIASPNGAGVPAVGDGVVRFAGTVVHNLTVSVDHGGGVVTSYSYLSRALVSKGDRVGRGRHVGTSGVHDGAEGYHLSLRIGGRYVDPLVLRRCRSAPSAGLYLAGGSSTYAVGRARDSRRYIRSTTQRPSRDGQECAEPTRTRRHSTHACR